MAVRQVLDWLTEGYLFTTELLQALRVHFPFMATWEPAEIGNSYFALGYEEEPYWMKHFMEPDNPGEGVRELLVSNGTDPFQKIPVTSGDCYLHEIIPDGTKYVIMKHKQVNPDGSSLITYTLHGKETVVYPLGRPDSTEATQIATMVARECGIAV